MKIRKTARGHERAQEKYKKILDLILLNINLKLKQ